MDDKTREQADAKAAAMAAKLNDDALCIAWMITENTAVTEEIAITRGWLLDELHKRLGDDLFDEWLVAVDENGKGVDPLSFLERKEPVETADERPVHIRQRIARKRGNGFYRVQYGPGEKLYDHEYSDDGGLTWIPTNTNCSAMVVAEVEHAHGEGRDVTVNGQVIVIDEGPSLTRWTPRS